MLLGLLFSATLLTNPVRVKVHEGTLEGAFDPATGVRTFKGVPFAAPPVGPLRWQPPRPAKGWKGVRAATEFAARPMQLPVFGDMVFRSKEMSEDCLYLNVWAPETPKSGKLPVLVYFYGGGFIAGAADEPRYDGEAMARKGVIAITVNYRLGIFGFFAHPELRDETPEHAVGNYGLLDQTAALRWVQKNVAAFGGDPKRVTIGGESAGSFSVSAQMASPLSKNLIAGAIGESGAVLGQTLAAQPLLDAEARGYEFGKKLGKTTVAQLRAMTAQELLDATKPNPFQFGLVQDGYFFPKSPAAIYAAGEQVHVPLLAGWNAEESGAAAVLRGSPATPDGLAAALRRLYPARADEAIKTYAAATPEEAKQAATELASALFIGYGTWRWTDLHAKNSGRPVYRYLFTQPRPGEGGAYHAVEIEYALGNLNLNKRYRWTELDWKISGTMLDFFANFVKNGDPNGPGLPTWPANRGTGVSVMKIGVETLAAPSSVEEHYRFLRSIGGG